MTRRLRAWVLWQCKQQQLSWHENGPSQGLLAEPIRYCNSSSSPKTANHIGTLARWISLAIHALYSAGVRVRVKQTHGYTYTPTGGHVATHDRLIGFDPWWEPKLWISADIKLKCDLRHFRLNPVWGGETSSGAVRVNLDLVGNGWWLYVVAV